MTNTSKPQIPWLRVFVEGVVIVGSILLAFGIDAWWDGRGERVREHEYLGQVLSDSRANLILLDSAIAIEGRHMRLAQNLESALQQVDQPDVDSVRAWLGRRDDGWWYSDPRLLDGTIKALVETGDLTLIRDPLLRSSVLGYQGQLVADMKEFERFIGRGADAHEELLTRGEASLDLRTVPGEDREVRRMMAMHGDAEGRAAMERLRQAYDNRIWYLEQMRLATEDLIKTLASP